MLLEPLDSEIEDLYQAYRYCKLFGCTIAEYEERPYMESIWLMNIDDTYNEVKREAEQQAQQAQQM